MSNSSLIDFSNRKVNLNLPLAADLRPSGFTGCTLPILYYPDLDAMALGEFPSTSGLVDNQHIYNGLDFESTIGGSGYTLDARQGEALDLRLKAATDALADKADYEYVDGVQNYIEQTLNQSVYPYRFLNFESETQGTATSPITYLTDRSSIVISGGGVVMCPAANETVIGVRVPLGDVATSIHFTFGTDPSNQYYDTIPVDGKVGPVLLQPGEFWLLGHNDRLNSNVYYKTYFRTGSGITGSTTIDETNLVHLTGDETITGVKRFAAPLYVRNEGGATAGNAMATFTSPTSVDPSKFFTIAINKNGYEAYLLGINKDSQTYAIPPNAAFFTSYTSRGSMSFGRGDDNGYPRTSDLFIASDGKVGVGTTNPSEQMEVAGNIKAQKFIGDGSQLTNLPQYVIDETRYVHATGNEVIDGAKSFKREVVITAGVNIASTPQLKIATAAGGVYGTAFDVDSSALAGGTVWRLFATANGAGEGNNKFIINHQVAGGGARFTIDGNTSNIGIGTVSPTEKLDVVGNVKATKFIGTAATLTSSGDYQINPNLVLDNSSGSGTKIEFKSAGAHKGQFRCDQNGAVGFDAESQIDFNYFGNPNARFNVFKGGGTATGSIFTVQPSNRVGILNDSPSEALDVVGNVKATKFIGDGSQLTNLPTTPAILYSGTGQNINGAITQKATTDALSQKADLVNGKVPVPQLPAGSTTVAGVLRVGRGFSTTSAALGVLVNTAVEYVSELSFDYDADNSLVVEMAPGFTYNLKGFGSVSLRVSSTLAASSIGRVVAVRNTGIVATDIYQFVENETQGKVIATLNPGDYIWFKYTSTGYEIVARGSTGGAQAAGFTPATIKSAVRAVAENSWVNGELSGATPAGSVANMKFADVKYRYEYTFAAADTDGTKYIWTRTTKA